MVSVAGMTAAESVVDRLTTNPPVAAGEFNVMVAVADLPPRRLVGLKVNMSKTGGFTVNVPEADRPPYEAETVATFWAETAVV